MLTIYELVLRVGTNSQAIRMQRQTLTCHSLCLCIVLRGITWGPQATLGVGRQSAAFARREMSEVLLGSRAEAFPAVMDSIS